MYHPGMMGVFFQVRITQAQESDVGGMRVLLGLALLLAVAERCDAQACPGGLNMALQGIVGPCCTVRRGCLGSTVSTMSIVIFT